MKAALGRIWTLGLVLLREQGRERAETLLSFALLLGAGLFIGWMPPDLFDPGPDDQGGAWTCEVRPAEPPAVAAAGAVPGWLAWPEALVAPEDAEVLLRFSADRVEVMPLVQGAHLGAVTPCLRVRVAEERERRLDALGVLAPDEDMLDVQLDGDPPSGGAFQPVAARIMVGTSLCMVALSVVLSVSARARSSGFRETLSAGPVSAGEWVATLLGLALFSAVVCALVTIGAVHLGSALAGRRFENPEPLGALLLCLFCAVLALRAGHDAPDLMAAMTRIVALTFVIMAIGGGSALVDQTWSGVGWLVPGGSLLRALLGEPLSGAALLRNAGVTLGAVALLLRGTVRAVEADDPTLAPSTRALLRREGGDWGPEALALGLISLAGSFFASPWLGRGDPLATTALMQLAFLLGPALLAPSLFGLPAARLLGLARPRAWQIALIPALVVGTLCGAELAWRGSLLIFDPPMDALEAMQSYLGELSGGPGLLVMTVGAGVFEELYFRGLLMGLLLERGRPWRALLWQAAAFAVFHALGFRYAPTFAIGLLLGLLRLRAGTVLLGVAVHAIHNYTAAIYGGQLGLETRPLWQLALGLAVGLGALWGVGRREEKGVSQVP